MFVSAQYALLLEFGRAQAPVADGLDKALTDNDPDTRELMLSTDKKQYLWGLNRLLGRNLDAMSAAIAAFYSMS